MRYCVCENMEVGAKKKTPAGKLLAAELDTRLSLKHSRISVEFIIHSYDTVKLVFVERM